MPDKQFARRESFRYLARSLDHMDGIRGLAMWQRQGDRLDMVAWDWLEWRWREAPDLVAPMLFGDEAGVDVVAITRAKAEEVANQLGIAPVPTEEEAMALVDQHV